MKLGEATHVKRMDGARVWAVCVGVRKWAIQVAVRECGARECWSPYAWIELGPIVRWTVRAVREQCGARACALVGYPSLNI